MSNKPILNKHSSHKVIIATSATNLVPRCQKSSPSPNEKTRQTSKLLDRKFFFQRKLTETNPNHDWSGQIRPFFIFYKSLWHLSKFLFFGLLSFPLVFSVKKIVLLLLQEFIIIMTGGGKYDLTKKRNYS